MSGDGIGRLHVDQVLLRVKDGRGPAVKAHLGIAEGGVGLAYNEIYDEVTPDAVKNLVTAVQDAVIAGDITVNTVVTDEASAA